MKNSNEFSNFIQFQQLADDDKIVSFDVTLLFTSIPVELTLLSTSYKKPGNTWKSHTSLIRDQIVQLKVNILIHPDLVVVINK